MGASSALDLRLRNTAAAEALRRWRGMSTERGSTGAVSVPSTGMSINKVQPG